MNQQNLYADACIKIWRLWQVRRDGFGFNAELGFDCLEMTPEATLYSVAGVAVLIANVPIE
ncbi:MAG: hypothetical protein WAN89_06985, partial [Lawsonella sp.]